jgi:hypothetical protein
MKQTYVQFHVATRLFSALLIGVANARPYVLELQQCGGYPALLVLEGMRNANTFKRIQAPRFILPVTAIFGLAAQSEHSKTGLPLARLRRAIAGDAFDATGNRSSPS